MIGHNARYSRHEHSVRRVINALCEFFDGENEAGDNLYVSTREIANLSEISIYNARHILMKLEKEGMIASLKKENCKSLYWQRRKLS